MPLVAKLVTKLEADTKSFNSKLAKSEGSLGKFGKAAAKTGAGVALAIGVVAVGAFVGLLGVINSTSDRIDALAKRAKKFGGDVSSFQRLEFVASLAGVKISTLEQGMGRLVKSLSDAKRGVGEAKDAFKELGLTVEALDKMSIDEQYIAISKAIQTVTDKNKQAQLSVQIFGRSGVEQLNLLRENLGGLSKEFDKFGGALTNEQAAAVEKYNDSVSRLWAIFDVFVVQLTAHVAPALELVTTFIGDQIIKFGGLKQVANLAARFMVSAVLSIVQSFQGLLDIMNEVQIKYNELIVTLVKVARIGTLGLSSLIGEKLFDVDLEGINKRIEELKAKRTDKFTAPLQQGLKEVQRTIQPQGQKVEVTIKADKGFKAEVAESPEIRKQIDDLYRKAISDNASTVGR